MLDPHTAAELSLEEISLLVDELLAAHGDWIPPLAGAPVAGELTAGSGCGQGVSLLARRAATGEALAMSHCTIVRPGDFL